MWPKAPSYREYTDPRNLPRKLKKKLKKSLGEKSWTSWLSSPYVIVKKNYVIDTRKNPMKVAYLGYNIFIKIE